MSVLKVLAPTLTKRAHFISTRETDYSRPFANVEEFTKRRDQVLALIAETKRQFKAQPAIVDAFAEHIQSDAYVAGQRNTRDFAE